MVLKVLRSKLIPADIGPNNIRHENGQKVQKGLYHLLYCDNNPSLNVVLWQPAMTKVSTQK